MEIKYRFLDAVSDTEIIQWLELYQVCFQDTVSSDFWYWIHEENPFYTKTKPLVFIAELNNRIVGSLSLIPSQYNVRTQNTNCLLDSCLVHTAMVHPELRGRGIFSTLLANAIKMTKDEDYVLLLALSNNLNSYQSMIHAGFTYVTDIKETKAYLSVDGPLKKYLAVLPQYLRKKIGFPLTQIYAQLIPNISHNFQVYYGNVSEFIGEINKIKTLIPDNPGIYGVRTSPFIRWRFSCPVFHYKCLSLWDGEIMLAYLIISYAEKGKDALIADLYAREDDENLILILVSEIVAILKKDNFNSIWTYLLERKWNLSRLFSLRHGFIYRPSRTYKLPNSRFLYYLLKENSCSESFSDKNQWNLMPIDTSFFERIRQ